MASTAIAGITGVTMLFIFQQLPQAFSSVRINLSWIRKKDIQFPSVHFRYPFRYLQFGHFRSGTHHQKPCTSQNPGPLSRDFCTTKNQLPPLHYWQGGHPMGQIQSTWKVAEKFRFLRKVIGV